MAARIVITVAQAAVGTQHCNGGGGGSLNNGAGHNQVAVAGGNTQSTEEFATIQCA